MSEALPPALAPPAPGARGAYVYVLLCGDGSLYTGWTVDVAARLAAHEAGLGARYTRGRGPLRLVAWQAFPDRRAAMAAEARFKRLNRSEKIALLAGAGAGPSDAAPRSGKKSATNGSWWGASWV